MSRGPLHVDILLSYRQLGPRSLILLANSSVRHRSIPDVPVHLDRVILAAAHHGLPVDIHPEAYACVALDPLQHRL
ncbi:hypothetical protein NM208_g15990 [Fusarium decemcellulare]|uniref:Uncharacterized protein n=1 Tax=Fusarium decemcellulare TaxID=57161 RepID=A0ACC1REW2_9HYPO|nr:hypothetical protein NM208_g15990 [Fusarium decemcellulare]